MTHVLVFTVAKANALASEPLLRSSYGPRGMVCTVENEVWDAFLPENALARFSDEGYANALDTTFLPRYKDATQKLAAALRCLEARRKGLPKLSNEGVFSYLDDFIGWAVSFFNTYNQTEFFCFTKIEDEIKDYAKDSAVLAELLSEKSLPKNLPEKIAQLTIFTREIQKLRWQLRKILNKAYMGDSVFVALIMGIAKRTNRPDIDCLTLDETKRVLEGKNVPDASHRRNALVASWNGGMKLETGFEAEARIEELTKMEGKELKGTVASPGKAQGSVRIIPLAIDPAPYLAKMRKGEILVASTTGPEMMVAIQKASAIVTDEGGLMSHAAVVSRELRIPCVVGTRYATKILKDGDMIEVDAEKGIVRKVK